MKHSINAPYDVSWSRPLIKDAVIDRHFPDNPQIQGNRTQLKYTDTGAIFDIMAHTVIQHGLEHANAA